MYMYVCMFKYISYHIIKYISYGIIEASLSYIFQSAHADVQMLVGSPDSCESYTLRLRHQ